MAGISFIGAGVILRDAQARTVEGLNTAATVWAGISASQMVSLRGEAEDAARQTVLLASQYAEVTRQFPQAPTSAENLKRSVEISQKLRDSLHTPQSMLGIVSRAIETSPTIVIREFGWKYGATEVESQGTRSRSAADVAPAASAGGIARSRKESAFRGDYRSAIVTINAFAGRIAGEPGVAEVRVVKLPLDVNPSLSLSGNTTENPERAATATAEFKLLIVLKPNT